MSNIEGGYLSTYQLCAQLGITIKVKDLKALGLTPSVATKIGAYWHESRLPEIRRAIAHKLIKDNQEVCGFIPELVIGPRSPIHYQCRSTEVAVRCRKNI